MDGFPVTAAVIAAAIYGVFAQAAAVYATIEIGPNLLAAITSIIGAVVLIAQLMLGRRVAAVKQTADAAHEIVERRQEDLGPDARGTRETDTRTGDV